MSSQSNEQVEQRAEEEESVRVFGEDDLSDSENEQEEQPEAGEEAAVEIDRPEQPQAQPASSYEPAPGDICENRPQPPRLDARNDTTCVLAQNPRYVPLPDADRERQARVGLACGRQRPLHRNYEECGRCPGSGWTTAEENAFRTGYDWWLWVDGGERNREQKTQAPYVSTDEALTVASAVNAVDIDRTDGYMATAATEDGYVRVFNAKTGAINQVWKINRRVQSISGAMISQQQDSQVAPMGYLATISSDGYAAVYSVANPYGQFWSLLRDVEEGNEIDRARLHGNNNMQSDISLVLHNETTLIAVTCGDGDGKIRLFVGNVDNDQAEEDDDDDDERDNTLQQRRSIMQERKNLFRQTSEQRCVCVSSILNRDFVLIAAGFEDGRVAFWRFNVADLAQPSSVVTEQEQQPLSPLQETTIDGRRAGVSNRINDIDIGLNSFGNPVIVAGSQNGTVQVWSLEEVLFSEDNLIFFEKLKQFLDTEILAVSISSNGIKVAWTTSENKAYTNQIDGDSVQQNDIVELEHRPLLRSLVLASLTQKAISPRTSSLQGLTEQGEEAQEDEAERVSATSTPQWRFIVGHSERVASLYDSPVTRTQQIGVDQTREEEQIGSVLHMMWYGHTSFPTQSINGASPTEIRQPLPGLPVPKPLLPELPFVDVSGWQEKLFANMRVGRVVGRPPQFKGDLKYYWRAIQMLDLRRLLVANQQTPFWWSYIADEESKREVKEMQTLIDTLGPRRRNQQMSQEERRNREKLERLRRKYAAYVLLVKGSAHEWPLLPNDAMTEQQRVDQQALNRALRDNDYTVWKEVRSVVNLKDKWRNLTTRNYVRVRAKEVSSSGRVWANSRSNTVTFDAGAVNPVKIPIGEAAWIKIKRAGKPTIGVWARKTGNNTLSLLQGETKIPSIQQSNVDATVGETRNKYVVTIEVPSTCILDVRNRQLSCASGHSIDPRRYPTAWVTVRRAGADNRILNRPHGSWAEVVDKTTLRFVEGAAFPTALAANEKIVESAGETPNRYQVTIDVDERRMQQFAVRSTISLMKNPTLLLNEDNNNPLRSIFRQHPLVPKIPGNDTVENQNAFISAMVDYYERAANSWRNIVEPEDLHDRRLWETIAHTLAMLEWRDWTKIDVARDRNWTALLDMYQRTHSHPFYVADENGVLLHKFCVVGAKEAAKKARSRNISLARVQTPRSNLFKKYEVHVYDTCTHRSKDIERFSEKFVPVKETYRRPVLPAIQEILSASDLERRRAGFGPLYSVQVSDPWHTSLVRIVDAGDAPPPPRPSEVPPPRREAAVEQRLLSTAADKLNASLAAEQEADAAIAVLASETFSSWRLQPDLDEFIEGLGRVRQQNDQSLRSLTDARTAAVNVGDQELAKRFAQQSIHESEVALQNAKILSTGVRAHIREHYVAQFEKLQKMLDDNKSNANAPIDAQLYLGDAENILDPLRQEWERAENAEQLRSIVQANLEQKMREAESAIQNAIQAIRESETEPLVQPSIQLASDQDIIQVLQEDDEDEESAEYGDDEEQRLEDLFEALEIDEFGRLFDDSIVNIDLDDQRGGEGEEEEGQGLMSGLADI